MAESAKKQKDKIGICEVHFYNNDDRNKRKVKWVSQYELWVCAECDDTILIAMATIGKKQVGKKKK